MRRRSFLSTALLGSGAAILAPSVQASVTEKVAPSGEKILAPRPPLGWNSFDSYGVYLHHDAAMANLKAMSEKLKPHGYEYFVIDGGWYGEFELIKGTIYPAEKHAKKVNMDGFGIYQPSKTYFPKGFKEIVDYGHSLGLKLGLHLMRGIPKAAVEQNLPIKNSVYRAADVADKERTCAWNHQNYGVDTSKPGAQEWYNSVYKQVADWGFDFVKVDDLTPYPDEIVMIAKAIKNSERTMLYSLSPGDGIYLPDMPHYRHAQMLRTTGDIWDRASDIDKGFAAWKKFQGKAMPGFWPDLDMIPFGNLQMMAPKKYADGDQHAQYAGFGHTRKSNFTPAQMRTFITMRALAASPLFVGGDLPTIDDYSLQLLTNKEMLACNQNGECGWNVYEKEGIEVWLVSEFNQPGKGWLGIFNRTGNSQTVELTREQLGLMKFVTGYKLVPEMKTVHLTDIWKNEQFDLKEPILKLMVDGNDVSFLRFEIIQP